MASSRTSDCDYELVSENGKAGASATVEAAAKHSVLKQVRIVEQPRHVKEAVVIILHASYLVSGSGICRSILMLASFVAFLLISLCGDKSNHYLATEAAWKFRVYIFVAVFCCLSCAVVIFLNLTSLHAIFSFDWNFIDYFHYSFFAIANLISSSILASTRSDAELLSDSKYKALLATCWGYACMFICVSNTVVTYRRRKTRSQAPATAPAIAPVPAPAAAAAIIASASA